jgi:hypothetical protein
MTSRISNSIRLAGLIVTTKPFEYSNDVVTCQYESHLSLNDLRTLKSELESELSSKPAGDVDTGLMDDIYFLNSILEKLENS